MGTVRWEGDVSLVGQRLTADALTAELSDWDDGDDLPVLVSGRVEAERQ